jgi:hypothetical protein
VETSIDLIADRMRPQCRSVCASFFA